MSVEEIIAAVNQLPQGERRRVLEALRTSEPEPADPMAGFGEDKGPKRLARRAAVIDEARAHWRGGEGLDYQRRIRTEWDRRTGPERTERG